MLAARLVEVDRAVHDAVVGEPDRRLAVGGRALGDRRFGLRHRAIGIEQ